MKVFGLDGKEYSWNLVNRTSRANFSDLHKKAKKLLKELFPLDTLIEEIALPGTKTTLRKQFLFADFFIPQQRLIVEVQGEQHYKDNRHFFPTKMDFFKAQARDRDKRSWCEINNIRLVELPFSEDEDEWTKRINGE